MSVDSDALADAFPQDVSPNATPSEPVGVGPATSEYEAPAAAARFSGGARSWTRMLAYGILPGLALLLTMGAGYLKWQDGSSRQSLSAAEQSVAVATDSTIALLSYRPDTVEKELVAARHRLTGSFLDAYTQLIHDVVIPGAKEKQISATATVPAAASISAGETHAEVLVFINQTVTIGGAAPTTTTSSVRVTLDQVQDRWLISQFEPV